MTRFGAVALSTRKYRLELIALLFAVILAHKLIGSGYIGYAFDWNVPATAQGLYAWGVSDTSPWRPIEFGLPLAYPTDAYLKLIFAVLGWAHIVTSWAIFVFLVAAYTTAFVGAARAVFELFAADTLGQIIAGALYVGSPFCFNATVTGYITTLLSVAAFPWILVSLVRALNGSRRAWWQLAFWCAVSLSQIQYAIFDVLLALTLLASFRANFMQYMRAGAAILTGFVGCYLFILANLFTVKGEFSQALTLSQHAWTELNAPGIWRALAQQPSFYSFFADSTGSFKPLWFAIGTLLTLTALIAAFRSRQRSAVGLAILALAVLIFLNGVNRPLGFVVSWIYNAFPVMALLRNMNYLFGVLSLLIAVLLVAKQRDRQGRNASTLALLLLTCVWTAPFWTGRYTNWIPVLNDHVPQIIGEDGRHLVWPHLAVVDSSFDLPSGINPNAVETVTPIFVRNTPTGMLEASLLDRTTDWAPVANTLGDFMSVGRIGLIDVQKQLQSHYVGYVDSYADPWIVQAYRTEAILARLRATGMFYTENDNLAEFGGTGRNDMAMSSNYVLLDGGVQEAAALESVSPHLASVDAATIDNVGSLAPAPSGFVKRLGAPNLLLDASDLRRGFAHPGGAAAGMGAVNFHSDWVDVLQSQDWWLSSRLLQEPHAAVTDSATAMLAVPLPLDHVHVWVEYFASLLGGTVEIREGNTIRRVVTSDANLGEYRWLDLGWIDGRRVGAIQLKSRLGLNAIGRVIALPASALAKDNEAYEKVARLPEAIVQPDVSLPGTYHVRIDKSPAQAILSAPSSPLKIRARFRLVRGNGTCDVRISNVHLLDYQVKLDGREYNASTSDASLISGPCASTDAFTINGNSLTSSLSVQSLSGSYDLRQRTRTGVIQQHSLLPKVLPLALPGLGQGLHTIAILRKPLIEAPARWQFEDLRTSSRSSSNARAEVRFTRGQTFIRFASDRHSVEMRTKLNAIDHGDAFVEAGTYNVDPTSSIRISVYDARTHRALSETLLPHMASPSTFVFRITGVESPHAVMAVDFNPGTGVLANGWLRMGEPLRDESCNLELISPRFPVGDLHDEVIVPRRFQRYKLSEAGPVFQYAQTFDNGWDISAPSTHLMSTSGFNLWLVPSSLPSPPEVTYKPAMAYSFLLIASAAIFVALFAGGFLQPPSRNQV